MKDYELTITLEHAKKVDFVELVTSHPKPEYKIRLGVPYWLLNSKGVIEHNNYITNDTTSFKQLADYFARQQILTIKK